MMLMLRNAIAMVELEEEGPGSSANSLRALSPIPVAEDGGFTSVPRQRGGRKQGGGDSGSRIRNKNKKRPQKQQQRNKEQRNFSARFNSQNEVQQQQQQQQQQTQQGCHMHDKIWRHLLKLHCSQSTQE